MNEAGAKKQMEGQLAATDLVHFHVAREARLCNGNRGPGELENAVGRRVDFSLVLPSSPSSLG